MSAMGSDVDLRTDRSTKSRTLYRVMNFDYLSNSSSARRNQQQRLSMSMDHRFDSSNSINSHHQFTTQQTDARSTSDYRLNQ
jgi:hypothetical protein